MLLATMPQKLDVQRDSILSSKIPTRLMDNLNQKAHRDFIFKVYNYLEEFFPDTHDFFNEEQIRNTIQLGIEKAHSYKIYSKNDICSYICLMFTFMGSHFDVDPLYPWANQILKPVKNNLTPTITASEKVVLLWKKQQEIDSKLFSSNSTFLIKQFQTLGSLKLLNDFEETSLPLRHRVHSRLESHYPEKYNLIERQSIDSLITEGFELCRVYNINDEAEICWFISLMFLFGSRFDADPKYPIYEYLKEKKTLTPGELPKELKIVVKEILRSKINSLKQLKETA